MAPPPVGPQRKGFAIASLVLGILSLISCSLLGIGGILGIVFGIVALVKSSNKPQEYGGKGMAITGITLSAASFVMSLFAAVAIPNLLRSRQAANEVSAISALRTISVSQMTYFSNQNRYGSLEDLYRMGLVDAALRSGIKSGYRYQIRLVRDSFEATATPLSSGTFGTATRSFYVGPDMAIRQAPGSREATGKDPPLDSGRGR